MSTMKEQDDLFKQKNRIKPDLSKIICDTFNINTGLFDSYKFLCYVEVPKVRYYYSLEDYQNSEYANNSSTVQYLSSNFEEGGDELYIPIMCSLEATLIVGVSRKYNIEDEIRSALSKIKLEYSSLTMLKGLFILSTFCSKLPIDITINSIRHLQLTSSTFTLSSPFLYGADEQETNKLISLIPYINSLIAEYKDVKPLLTKFNSRIINGYKCEPFIHKLVYSNKIYYIYVIDNRIKAVCTDRTLVEDKEGLFDELSAKLALMEVI